MKEKSPEQMLRETRALATKVENDRLGKTIIQSFTNGEIRQVSNYGEGAQQNSAVIREPFTAGEPTAGLEPTQEPDETIDKGNSVQEVVVRVGETSLNISGVFSPDRYAILAPLE